MARILRFSITLGKVERRLKAKYPDAKPIRGATDNVNHTLWMIRQIPHLDSQRKVIAWYNWILAKAHDPLKLFDEGDDELTEIRAMAKEDSHRLQRAYRDLIMYPNLFSKIENPKTEVSNISHSLYFEQATGARSTRIEINSPSDAEAIRQGQSILTGLEGVQSAKVEKTTVIWSK